MRDRKPIKNHSMLRQKAEERLDEGQFPDASGTPQAIDFQRLLHELRVHQIELELQNEELRGSNELREKIRQEAENARDQFIRLFHEAPVGYATVDQSGMVLEANFTLRDMTGISLDAPLMRLAFADLVRPADESMFRARYQAFFDQPDNKRIELRLKSPGKDTPELWVEITGRNITWHTFHPHRPYATRQLLLVVNDIQARKHLEAELSMAAQVFEHSAEGIVITDPTGRIMRVNNAFTLVTGYQEDEVIGQTPRLLNSGRHPATFYQKMWQTIINKGRWEGEIWNKRKNGEIYPEWLGISSVRSDSDKITHFIGIFSDITERKVAERQLEHLAHHDPLTSLPNRMLFHDRLKQSLMKAKRYNTWQVVMMLDLDRFKGINDHLGHDSGDVLLQQVARRLEKSIRASDTLARLGGDEFVILLADYPNSDTASSGAAKVAGQITDCFAEPFNLNGQIVTVTTSVGIAIYPQDGTTMSDIVKHADTAMYSAKDRGRNNFQFYSSALHAKARARASMDQGLRQALEKKELFLVYQPQINLCAGRIIGMEALLRWRHKGKLIPPNQFIPVAEDTGQIMAISAWVLHEACAMAASLGPSVGPSFRVAINLSVRQLNTPQHFVNQVREALDRWQLSPSSLEFEITESAMIQETESAQWALTKLKDMGIHIALDDFGTGFSSLSYLRRFPIDTLKIDQSFIKDIGRDPEDEAIVRSTIALAQSLGMEVIAEGIEHDLQRYFLLDNGCSSGQGYLFWKPMPTGEINKVLSNGDDRWAALPVTKWSPPNPLKCY